MLSTEDLMQHIEYRKTKKLIEQFVRLYKRKRIISANIVELELLESIKIFLVVNVSRIVIYKEQVKGQKKILPYLVKIEKVKEYEVEKLNRKYMREKPKYLVRQKDYGRSRYLGGVRKLKKMQKGQQNSFINSMKMRKQKELEYYGNLIEEKKV